jgi:hypothetical protein
MLLTGLQVDQEEKVLGPILDQINEGILHLSPLSLKDQQGHKS